MPDALPYILATAGHVDHGKTAIVRALTGTDPDRLPEEKSRGITIDLGFATADLLATDGRTVRLGVVDVPGHEDFVHNMVAGVGQRSMWRCWWWPPTTGGCRRPKSTCRSSAIPGSDPAAWWP